MDYHDGKYGVNTDSRRGADTFIPFNKFDVNKIIIMGTEIDYGNYTASQTGLLCGVSYGKSGNGVYLKNNKTGEEYGVNNNWTSTYKNGAIKVSKGDSVYLNGSGTRLFFYYTD